MVKKIFVVIFFIYAYFLMSVICYSDNNAQTMLLKLRDLEKEILSNDELSQESRKYLLVEMEELAKEMITLRLNKQNYRASYIYFSENLEDKYICNFIYPDGTIYITDFPAFYEKILFSETDKLKIEIISPYKIEDLVFYMGEPAEMHINSYANIKPLVINKNNILETTIIPEDKKFILFTIIKDKNDLMYKKYVWIIEKKLLSK